MTIQLDSQLPERFNLRFRSANKASVSRFVIIHCAMFGSLGRVIAIIAVGTLLCLSSLPSL